MNNTLKTPEFNDEHEAAKWFDENEDELLSQFQAAAAGTLRHGTLARRGVATSILLDSADIELAKVQAAQRSLRYETYLKMILHQHLERGAGGPAPKE